MELKCRVEKAMPRNTVKIWTANIKNTAAAETYKNINKLIENLVKFLTIFLTLESLTFDNNLTNWRKHILNVLTGYRLIYSLKKNRKKLLSHVLGLC